ncbi:sulfur carrier protein ThiS [Hyphomicrobium sp. CS1GBMeth3]|uniref:sulfur carrier protein ThiS n=1 Tax=Hyphomicrobium sp. CS1GBMeth3 TaxID=1892845 RepID=UPI000931AAB9|nr:sulfur carrier protein ThiS [Hyphomicrobium sp. CS1GBMeth3]
MTIIWNGAEQEVQSQSLAEVLRELGYQDDAVATAVNGTFVPARQRGTLLLNSGDALEVLAPRQGG